MSAGPIARRVLAAMLLVAAAPGGSDGDPASYRVRLPVRPAAGATVQRLALPAQVLAAAQRDDLGDLRLFDARGRAMPIARAANPVTPLRRDTLPALPILGPADGLKITGVSLRLDDRGRVRLAELDGTPLESRGGPVLLGILLDARRIAGAARRLTLDADIPVAQPVTFAVDASRDLKSWRRIGDEVAYRGSPDARVGAAIALGGADLRHDYLRVTWSAGARLLSPVAVRGATLITRARDAATVGIDATLPPLADARTIDIAIPFRTPIATIRIAPVGDDMIVPVRILGRDNRERPWTLLGRGTARRDGTSDIAVSGAAFAMLRIEADARTAGFTTPPGIRFGFAPRAIAFLAAGAPPFELAVGNAQAAEAYLPLASLTGAAATPSPDARIADSRAALRLDLVDAAAGDRRQWLLWAILLGATALLGAMAWLLWRQTVARD